MYREVTPSRYIENGEVRPSVPRRYRRQRDSCMRDDYMYYLLLLYRQIYGDYSNLRIRKARNFFNLAQTARAFVSKFFRARYHENLRDRSQMSYASFIHPNSL